VFPHWEAHEPSRGVFDWDSYMYDAAHGYYANAVTASDLCQSRGEDVIVCLGDALWNTASWTDTSNDTDLYNYVFGIAQRTQSDLWEPANEPSNLPVDMTLLVHRFDIACQAIKAARPSARIIGPSCESIVSGGTGVAYTTSFLQSGGAALIDILGVHLYPHGTQVAGVNEPVSILAQMAYLKAQIAGLWAGPIWNTECGMNVMPNNFDTYPEADQVRRAFQLWVLPIAAGCERSYLYAHNQLQMGFQTSPYLGTSLLATWRSARALAKKTLASSSVAGLQALLNWTDGTSSTL